MLELLLAVEVGNWQKIDVWVAGIAAAALVIVLGFTIKTANAARDTANEARLANILAQEEMDIRLAPYISVRDLKGGQVEDINGQILAHPDPTTGFININEIPNRGVPRVMSFSVEIENSGLTPAANMGFAHGHGFERAQAVADMRAMTGFLVNVWPPGVVDVDQFLIPLDDIIVARTDPERPYYVAVGVAYKDRLGDGRLVESEWELKTSRINCIRQTIPEPYPPTLDVGDNATLGQSGWISRMWNKRPRS